MAEKPGKFTNNCVRVGALNPCVAGLQQGSGRGNRCRRGDSPGELVAEPVVGIIADADRAAEVVERMGLEFRISGAVAVVGVDRREDAITAVLGAEDEGLGLR